MFLELQRFRHSSYGTFGQLILRDGDKLSPLCYTLEPSDESKDLFGSVCIETGEYKISITYSQRFKKLLPYVWHTKRSGIRIHSGNCVEDTQGCILVGLFDNVNSITYSRLALQHVLQVINNLKINKLKIIQIYGQVPNF